MKRLIFLILLGCLLQSCVSSNINSHQLVKQPQKLERLLLLVSGSENIFYEWNEENYNAVLLGQFNSLDGQEVRKGIQNQLQQHLNTVLITPADKLFDIHRLVSMDEFMLHINELEFDGILLVHTRELWTEQQFMHGDVVNIHRSQFHVFLMNGSLFETQYISRMNLSGGAYTNFNSLFNRFSRDLARDLSNKGFIKRPALL